MRLNEPCADRYKTYLHSSSPFGMTHTRTNSSLSNMSDQGDRLKKALDDSGLSMREASDRWAWSYNTLKSNANGTMPFSYKKALVYGGRLKVRAEWLFAGTGSMREPTKAERRSLTEVPVIAWVQAGSLVDRSAIDDLGELERVTMEGLGAGDWFATDVRGDSMDRVSPEGSRIFVNSEDRTLISGRYYLFSLRGEATYKRFYDEPVRRLEPYSTNPANKTIFLTNDPDWVVIGRVHRSVIDLTKLGS